MNPFPRKLHFDNAGIIRGARTIVLTCCFDCITSAGVITAPKGMFSDGASIPRAAQAIVGNPFDEYLESAVIHDYLYSHHNQSFSRTKADFLLRELMINQGVARWKAYCFWLAVRMFGAPNFKGLQ